MDRPCYHDGPPVRSFLRRLHRLDKILHDLHFACSTYAVSRRTRIARKPGQPILAGAPARTPEVYRLSHTKQNWRQGYD